MMQLVDTGYIANLLGVTRAHVTDRITKQMGFPKPYVNLSQKMRRWKAEDITTWMTK